jgi:Lon protease-like protein
MDPTLVLPLFPLNTVLFPGATLPLRIFEPRYRALTHACLAGDRRFGVVLIAEGPEVGGPARPHAVGTVARIVQAEQLADGRFNLTTVGEGRFTIEQTWLEPAGYLAGRVLPRLDRDDEPADPQELAAAVRATLQELVGRLIPDPTPVQAEIAVLSATSLAGLAASLLRVENARKQAILEIDGAAERLRRLHALLRRELDLLAVLAQLPETPLRRDIISPN